VEESCFTLDDEQELHNADGICFFDRRRNLIGTVVNAVRGRRIYPQKMQGIRVGQKIYRNYDYMFCRKLAGRGAQRKISLSILLRETSQGLVLSGRDEDGNQAMVEIVGPKQPALKKQTAHQTIITQLTKLGNTIFECADVRLETQEVYFLPVSQLNSAKRELVRRILQVRRLNRPRLTAAVSKNSIPYPDKNLTYMGNVLNAKARAFYHRHGVQTIEPAAESGLDLSGRLIMTTKYCLRQEMGLCRRPGSKSQAEAMILQDEDGREYKLHFHCGRCGMEIFA
jgi:putative protease